MNDNDDRNGYHVLHRGNETQVWTHLGHVQARDPKHAIRTIVENLGAETADGTYSSNGTYVAVPARSWQPVTVTTRVETVVRLEGL